MRLADEAGVDKIVMLSWYWNDFGLCQYHNDYLKSVIDRYPDRFIAYASINPNYGWRAVYEIERCKKMGFAGLGELGPGGNHYSLNDPRLYQVLEAAEHFRLPVNIHSSEPVGHYYMGKDPTPIEGFYDIARQFPELRLIVAHMGGGLPFYELYPEIKETLRHVYYDMAGNPLLYHTNGISKVARLVGGKRLLYGSDFPLILYPDRQQDASFKFFMDDLREHSGIAPEDWWDIMGNNMQELIDYALHE